MPRPVLAYLDHAASAPLDQATRAAIAEALDCLGGPDALHPAGAAAARDARDGACAGGRAHRVRP